LEEIYLFISNTTPNKNSSSISITYKDDFPLRVENPPRSGNLCLNKKYCVADIYICYEGFHQPIRKTGQWSFGTQDM